MVPKGGRREADTRAHPHLLGLADSKNDMLDVVDSFRQVNGGTT